MKKSTSKNKSKSTSKNKSKSTSKNKVKVKVKSKVKNKCFKIYNPYHEALVYEKIGPGGNKPFKNVDKNWDKFVKDIKKDGYNCIKYSGGLENKKYAGKNIEKKV